MRTSGRGAGGRARTARVGRAALALAVALVLLGAACGTDTAARRTLDRAAGTTGPPTTSAPRTTSTMPASPTTMAMPTDPATLGSCDAVPDNMTAGVPARWWPADHEGWDVTYAGSGRIAPPSPESGTRWSSLLAHTTDGRRVDAMVMVLAVTAEGAGGYGTVAPRTETVRGLPASVGPEMTRGGPSGALQAEWVEDGIAMAATSRGLDAAGLTRALDGTRLETGVAVGAPSGWTIVGTSNWPLNQSSVGTGMALARSDAPAGADPPFPSEPWFPANSVEITVSETSEGERAPQGAVPRLIDVTTSSVELRRIDDRIALLATDPEGAFPRFVVTTNRVGTPVEARGDASFDELLRLASGVSAIDIDDPRLVGVAMGSPRTSPGLWCREDR